MDHGRISIKETKALTRTCGNSEAFDLRELVLPVAGPNSVNRLPVPASDLHSSNLYTSEKNPKSRWERALKKQMGMEELHNTLHSASIDLQAVADHRVDKDGMTCSMGTGRPKTVTNTNAKLPVPPSSDSSRCLM